MKYIESLSKDPYENLALEEYVFEKLPSDESYFMLWQNSRTIVVGKYQNTAEEVNTAYAEEHGIRIARRMSGGGAVYHDEGNLNFTFITDQPENPDIFDFRRFSEPLLKVLKDRGLNAEFSGRNDVLLNGKKICGNAQYMKNGRLLHHGCILLDSDISEISASLNVRSAKFVSGSDPSVKSRVTTINSCLKEKMTMDQFREALLKEVFGQYPVTPFRMSTADLEEIGKLRDQKYASWEWIYGNNDPYEMRREEKFQAGLVTVSLSSEHGRIRKISFTGDFFGNGDIRELEQALEGAGLDAGLKGKLKDAGCSRYIYGVTPEQIDRLIRG